MAQKKISQFPQDSSPTITDSIPTYDAETVLTKRVLISDLITLFFNNTPAGPSNPITRFAETGFDFISSGGRWSGDSYAVNRNASMTACVVYVNGRRISITAVAARTFTASKDTYVDVLDNGDGTGTLVYTEVANNAASPALAASSLRIAIIVTGATTIAAAASINMGEPTAVLPIASSIPYVHTDSLGNLIHPRDSNRHLLGYTEKATGQSSIGAITDLTGMSLVVKTPANCYKLKLIAGISISDGTSGSTMILTITDGSNNPQAERSTIIVSSNVNAIQALEAAREIPVTPSTTYTFKIRVSGNNSTVNQGNIVARSATLRVERV